MGNVIREGNEAAPSVTFVVGFFGGIVGGVAVENALYRQGERQDGLDQISTFENKKDTLIELQDSQKQYEQEAHSFLKFEEKQLTHEIKATQSSLPAETTTGEDLGFIAGGPIVGLVAISALAGLIARKPRGKRILTSL